MSEISEVVDSIPDLVATFDRDGQLLLINAAGIELLGHSQRTLTELLITDLYTDEVGDRMVDEALHGALANGSWSGSADLLRADGETTATHQCWVAHRLDSRKARAFTLIARPLSESRRDSELRNRRESLAAMSLAFVHDLNNVLGPIIAYAELASSSVGADHPAARYLEQITRAAERGRGLTERLADLARARDASRVPVDVAELAAEVARWLRVVRPDLEVELVRDEDAITNVIGDPVQLHQVLLNLAKNAAEALSDRPGAVKLSIDQARPPRVSEGHHVRIAVQDDGRGIDEALRARIFEPFFSTRDDGSGLGLNVSREIVRAHEGIITLEPAEPTGTIATIYLPIQKR